MRTNLHIDMNPTFSHSTISDRNNTSQPPSSPNQHANVKSRHVTFSPGHIPSSVKGAPAHLRQVIRKRQNSESAKRSRKRRKEAAAVFYHRFEFQCQRIAALEKRVAELAEQMNECESTDADADAASEQQDSELQKDYHHPVVSTSSAQRPSPLDEDPLPLELLSKYVKEEDRISTQNRVSKHGPETDSYDDSDVSAARPFENDLEKLLDACIDVQDLLWSPHM